MSFKNTPLKNQFVHVLSKLGPFEKIVVIYQVKNIWRQILFILKKRIWKNFYFACEVLRWAAAAMDVGKFFGRRVYYWGVVWAVKILIDIHVPSNRLSFRNAAYLSERKQIENRPDFKQYR